MLEIRLPQVPDAIHNRSGRIDLAGLQTRFNICTSWPEHKPGSNSTWETHVFNLNTQEGWGQMLQTFPQQPRETLPEGITLQRHLRNLLENLRENPLGRNRAQKDPEFRHAVLTIHDAAHSRPGEFLTPEHTEAINRCLRTIRMKMPITREDLVGIDRDLRHAGLETIPSDRTEAPGTAGETG